MTAPTFEYDPTGSSPANLIIEEVHRVDETIKSNLFFIIPNYSPFFASSFIINFTLNNVTRRLTLGTDYLLALPFKGGSLETNLQVNGGIILDRLDTNGVITLTYQTFGGAWADTRQHVLNHFSMVSYNPEITLYDILIPNPLCFPTGPGEGDPAYLKGQNEVVSSIISLSTVIANRPSEKLIVEHLTAPSDPHGTTLELLGFRVATEADLQNHSGPASFVTHAQLLTLFGTQSVIDVAGTIILKPIILNPLNNSEGQPVNLSASSSNFETNLGFGAHYSSSWQLSSDENFLTIIEQSLNDVVNKTQWQPAELIYGNRYYLRVRYIGELLIVSEWSDTVVFNCLVQNINTPIIVFPITESVDQPETIIISSSNFIMNNATDLHVYSTWQLAYDEQFSLIVASTTNNAIQKITWELSGLLSNQKYYVRVLYTGEQFGSSEWSTPVSFTVRNFLILANSILLPSRIIKFNLPIFIPQEEGDVCEISDWQVSIDPGFLSISKNASELSAITECVANDLPSNCELYFRVRQKGSLSGKTQWLCCDSYEDLTSSVNTPEILSYNSSYSEGSMSITCAATPFSINTNSPDVFIKSTWQIAIMTTNPIVSNEVVCLEEPLTTVTFYDLEPGQYYYIYVKYTGENYGDSEWSPAFVNFMREISISDALCEEVAYKSNFLLSKDESHLIVGSTDLYSQNSDVDERFSYPFVRTVINSNTIFKYDGSLPDQIATNDYCSVLVSCVDILDNDEEQYIIPDSLKPTVYVRNNLNWELHSILEPLEDENSYNFTYSNGVIISKKRRFTSFGRSLSIDGHASRIAVGAAIDRVPDLYNLVTLYGYYEKRAVYIFAFVGGIWQQEALLHLEYENNSYIEHINGTTSFYHGPFFVKISHEGDQLFASTLKNLHCFRKISGVWKKICVINLSEFFNNEPLNQETAVGASFALNKNGSVLAGFFSKNETLCIYGIVNNVWVEKQRIILHDEYILNAYTLTPRILMDDNGTKIVLRRLHDGNSINIFTKVNDVWELKQKLNTPGNKLAYEEIGEKMAINSNGTHLYIGNHKNQYATPNDFEYIIYTFSFDFKLGV
jgi:hypothetical protein